MKLTAMLKQWLIDKGLAKATDDDQTFKNAVGDALADGTLSPEKYQELTTTKEDQNASDIKSLLKSINDNITASRSTGTDAGEKNTDTDTGTKTTDENENVPSLPLEAQLKSAGLLGVTRGDNDKAVAIRVKEAADQYSTTKSALYYPETVKGGRSHVLAGQRVKDFGDGGRELDTPSDRDKAIAGAWAKWHILTSMHNGSKRTAFERLNDHDRELLCFALENEKWGGATDGGPSSDINNRRLKSHEQKALIDDATSGGIEAAPIVFDDMVIQTPLLYGELYPKVNTINLDRGRRIEGVQVGTVTASWGGVDDTAISLFNTASFVSAFDTTIYRWEGAFVIGRDFLSDTPIDFAALVTQQYGERLLEDLDDAIATGNGTTQPEGVMTKSGTTSVSFGGTTSLGNYESLRFGVSKPEHRSNLMATACFCGTETSYERARAIPVGSSDARRLGGMDYDSYRWMNRDYAINESLTNQQIFYAILGRYRLYRRRGLTMRQSTEGSTLIRANELLIVAMARMGGQLERGAVAAVTSNAPA